MDDTHLEMLHRNAVFAEIAQKISQNKVCNALFLFSLFSHPHYLNIFTSKQENTIFMPINGQDIVLN